MSDHLEPLFDPGPAMPAPEPAALEVLDQLPRRPPGGGRPNDAVVRANAHRLPIRDGSVDLIVTSPPYFAVRSYRDAGEHLDGQLGDEETPLEFLEELWAITGELVRVLKPAGSLWVNLGDKYVTRGWGGGDYDAGHPRGLMPMGHAYRPAHRVGIPEKSLCGIPWRYALGCIDRLGLILRAELVWDKPNALPEPVTDRVRRSHETWFHFVKRPRYYAALDELREPQRTPLHTPGDRKTNPDRNDADRADRVSGHPLGRIPGSVWCIPTEPLAIPEWARRYYRLPDHFAAFPTEWPRRLIMGWSPRQVCTACGEGRFPVTERTFAGEYNGRETLGRTDAIDRRIIGYACRCTPYSDHPENERGDGNRVAYREADTRGPVRTYHLDRWEPAPTRPGVVLDPFGGTGTVAVVARALGRVGISLDLSADYCRLGRWRIHESGHGARAEDRAYADAQGEMFEVAP